jgi:hypothetical protein
MLADGSGKIRGAKKLSMRGQKISKMKSAMVGVNLGCV